MKAFLQSSHSQSVGSKSLPLLPQFQVTWDWIRNKLFFANVALHRCCSLSAIWLPQLVLAVPAFVAGTRISQTTGFGGARIPRDPTREVLSRSWQSSPFIATSALLKGVVERSPAHGSNVSACQPGRTMLERNVDRLDVSRLSHIDADQRTPPGNSDPCVMLVGSHLANLVRLIRQDDERNAIGTTNPHVGSPASTLPGNIVSLKRARLLALRTTAIHASNVMVLPFRGRTLIYCWQSGFC